MALVVQKFGGSSVADAEAVRNAAARVADAVRRGEKPVVTVSAMGRETDELLALAPAVSSVRPGRELDRLVTAGERKAAAVLALALQEFGLPVLELTGGEAGIITDDCHTRARVRAVHAERVRDALAAGFVPIIGGAQGMTSDGETTFVGRGGSDLTAVALAVGLGVEICELFTDVPGVLAAPPAIVPEARMIPQLAAAEMLELCRAGCPKPALRAVELAQRRGVRLHVRCTFSGEPGTWIEPAEIGGGEIEPAVLAVAATEAGVSLIGRRLDREWASRALAALRAQNIPATVCSCSRRRIAFAVEGTGPERAVRALHGRFLSDVEPGERLEADPPDASRTAAAGQA